MKTTNETIKSKINNVAKDYIFNYGIRGWNMNEFAHEAGITKRTLYNYITSKEALVETILIDYIEEVQKELVTTLKALDNFDLGIMHIIKVYPSMVIRMNSRVIKDIFLHYPSIEASVINQRQSLTEELTAYIHEAQQSNLISSDYDSNEIFDVIQSLIIHYSKHYPDHLEAKLQNSLSMLLHGIIQ